MKIKTFDQLLIDDYDDKKNPCSIYDFPINVRDKCWWYCSTCGYEWQATLASRRQGKGCPCCAGNVFVKGINDLESLFPAVASEWAERNEGSPSELPAHGRYKVWWKCPDCGAEYKARICDRTRSDRPTGCPYCAGKLTNEHNNLKVKHPEICLDWDYDNNDKNPEEYTPGSNKTVHWHCHVCGYQWDAPVYSRVSGCGCPRCSGRVVTVGENDLSSLRPDLFDQIIDPDVDTESLSVRSAKKVLWKCPVCGGKWKATVASRTQGAGCPYCSGRRAKPNKTDLASQYPWLMVEWDDSNIIDPHKESANSHKKVIWRCSKCGRTWLARISNRTSDSTGCPYCSKK